MVGDLIINGKDAYTTWGLSLTQGALTTLMTPPEMKDYITSKPRTESGTRIATNNVAVAERTISLDVHLSADTEEQFLERYASFCTVLAGGSIELSTRWQEGVTYHLYYQSCSQYSQLFGGLAKFTLKVYEPNPTNRQ